MSQAREIINELLAKSESNRSTHGERADLLEWIDNTLHGVFSHIDSINSSMDNVDSMFELYHSYENGWKYSDFPAVMEELVGLKDKIDLAFEQIKYDPEMKRAWYVFVTDKYYRKKKEMSYYENALYRAVEAIGRRDQMHRICDLLHDDCINDIRDCDYKEDQRAGRDQVILYEFFLSELNEFIAAK